MRRHTRLGVKRLDQNKVLLECDDAGPMSMALESLASPRPATMHAHAQFLACACSHNATPTWAGTVPLLITILLHVYFGRETGR
jgi:hypothetical protein